MHHRDVDSRLLVDQLGANRLGEAPQAVFSCRIPEAMLARIFEPFKRGKHRASSQGLGPGLYISNQIAVAHGGSLGVVSTDRETRFTFRMPLGIEPSVQT
nr:ATP-binding protein [Acidisphaera sp. L21]